MTGVSVWDETSGSERSIGSAKITLKLNTQMTSDAIIGGFSPNETVNYIITTLRNKGYIEGV